jgi:hypothetical protein
MCKYQNNTKICKFYSNIRTVISSGVYLQRYNILPVTLPKRMNSLSSELQSDENIYSLLQNFTNSALQELFSQ